MTRILIVGGVAGGASAAARARRMSEEAEIIMFDRGPYVSFANCGLPYHIGGDIELRDALLLQTPESFKQRFNVDVRVHSEVTHIDAAAKTITVKDLQTQQSYSISYDKLLLSPGAVSVRPNIPGLDNARTFGLRTIPDMDQIKTIIQQHSVQHATVVGGGYIGLEAVEALRQLNINVTLLELAPQVMTAVDPEMATPLHQTLRDHGVDLRLGTALESVSETENGLTLSLNNGDRLDTELLITAMGVKPDTSLAESAGVNIGKTGGIAVNEAMQTSVSDIYAVGDAVEHIDLVTQQPALIPLAGPANRQGRSAADNMLGGQKIYGHTQATAICRVFNLAAACTGSSEKSLLKHGVAYEKIYVHPMSHAGYFPGAKPVSLKLLFAPDTGVILGAQAVGEDGIDKRIDVLAVALRAGMTVFDLETLELCYAPPYGSAKDVVNLAGFVASNLLRGEIDICQVEDIIDPQPHQVVLDVRNPPELENVGAINGALNIPLDSLRDRLNELDRSKEYLVTCMVGLRAHVAYRLLVNSGFKAKNMTGGFKTYQMVKQQFKA
ncbi:FAD-dependent oxidoreductase [Echinimonas agarilytica]|uniref:FAD-dependent oxidoreductase n=1 Tax=Echinimonas agarilytica TaxID=1215918 RepID=A0AA42B683_9GAMM|nr:FAD-dependent oxidoreductase [Echinimonas agarilytica]MCM2678354.1 FAD-dependent oxidoreductase [Echinimonas agarilytica]